jgi:predicted acyl esterase
VDRVNYEVMGANVWRHAPSIAAMSNGRLRFYLNPTHRFSRERAPPDSAVTLRVDLAYRGDVDTILPGGGVRDTAVNSYLALEYVSDPITEPLEVSGLYFGHLEFVTNKRDFDLGAQLFELTPDGHYLQLPPFQVRASYNRDPSTRRLLTPNVRQTLDFTAQRLISWKLLPGSRIVLMIGPIKWPGQQINYGSGKDVNDETVQDAGAPLEIRWFGGSYVELPVRR